MAALWGAMENLSVFFCVFSLRLYFGSIGQMCWESPRKKGGMKEGADQPET